MRCRFYSCVVALLLALWLFYLRSVFFFYLRCGFFTCVVAFLLALRLFYLRCGFFICVVVFFCFFLCCGFFTCVVAILFAFSFFFYLRCGFFICVVIFLIALWYFYLRCVFFLFFFCFAPVGSGHRTPVPVSNKLQRARAGQTPGQPHLSVNTRRPWGRDVIWLVSLKRVVQIEGMKKRYYFVILATNIHEICNRKIQSELSDIK